MGIIRKELLNEVDIELELSEVKSSWNVISFVYRSKGYQQVNCNT